jgi:hypothetical protein
MKEELDSQDGGKNKFGRWGRKCFAFDLSQMDVEESKISRFPDRRCIKRSYSQSRG